ncbi:hypothetical protein [Agrobacterium pusense]|uniref:hypothetical protein n=1 Tax=Agrobacterium pusense TaxID=648995 RepID=UPI003FD2BA99|nr:hypothetical protein [Agrobacterium sp. S2]
MGQTVLTSGVHSEYVLGPLSEYLRKNGYNVVEIDFGLQKGDVETQIRELARGQVVYITSAHTNFSVRMARQILPLFATSYPNYLCPLEIIPLLGTNLKSIYVPHDLLTPYGDTNLQEFRFLSVYDHILAPANAHALKATIGGHTQVHDMGWIKFNSELRRKNTVRKVSGFKVSVFISMLEHLRFKLGLEGLVDYIKPIMKSGYSIKLPVWHGIDELERVLRCSGMQVVPSDVSSIELIDESDVVICNGASSIHAEAAYMGKPTICLSGEEGISSVAQKEKLSGFPEIYFMSHEQLSALDESGLKSIASKPRVVTPRVFEFSEVATLINKLFAA